MKTEGYENKTISFDYFDILKALREGREIFIVKNEMEVDILNSWGYIATTLNDFNGEKDFNIFRDAKIMVYGGTRNHTRDYIKYINTNIIEVAKELNVITLNDLDEKNENDSIIEWVERGNNKSDFKKAKLEVHDLKKHEIFKYVIKKEGRSGIYYQPQKIWENLECLLKYHNITIRFNKLAKRIEWKGMPEKNNCNDILCDINSLNVKYELNLNMGTLGLSLERISRKNTYSPVQEYLIECHKEYDSSKDYINILADTITQSGDFDEDIKKMYLRKWLLNCVNIAFNNNALYGSEGVLVFQGKQGLRKTTWIKYICPNDEWVKTGGGINPENKDDIINLTKYWLVELGELDATFDHDVKKLRKFITEGKDQYRLPYDKYPNEYPRFTNFFATVNGTEFLKDEAGNRRYWVIPVELINIEKFNEIEINKMWGQVMNIWKSKLEKHYLDETELKILNENNKIFEVETNEYSIVRDKLDWNATKDVWNKFKPTELAEALGIQNSKKLKSALFKMGIEQQRENDKSRSRYYLCPPLLNK